MSKPNAGQTDFTYIKTPKAVPFAEAEDFGVKTTTVCAISFYAGQWDQIPWALPILNSENLG